jgi:hypothetical protein
MSKSFPRRFQLLAAMNEARGRGDMVAFYRLEDEHLRELTGLPALTTTDSLKTRLDALRARLGPLNG